MLPGWPRLASKRPNGSLSHEAIRALTTLQPAHTPQAPHMSDDQGPPVVPLGPFCPLLARASMGSVMDLGRCADVSPPPSQAGTLLASWLHQPVHHDARLCGRPLHAI